MSINLERFCVYGLHGKFDIEIPIHENKVILIGVNGLGKTTVVNLIYFLLTRQWPRLLENEFRCISVQINGREILLERGDIQNKLDLTARYEKALFRFMGRYPLPASLIKQIFDIPSFRVSLELPPKAREQVARDISREIGIPFSHILRLMHEVPKNIEPDLFESAKDTPAMADFLNVIKNSGTHKVIYLPTYRRIEQDIKSIFPKLDEDDLRKMTVPFDGSRNPSATGHIELVHFGMQDVEKTIENELVAIRERTRNQLTNLTASYLKDIIRNRADTVEIALFEGIDERVVNDVLDRVEENTLSQQDKLEVKSAIGRISHKNSMPDARDKYLAYFFFRLLEIYFNLSESEANIKNLVGTCNKYFERKELVYDDSTFSASINDADGQPISWKVLSSGEKQVASLFTHLILSKDNEQTVIIDEPELSLSVPWQKSLLPDIMSSGRCNLLIAVTHSPFIYANDLDQNVVDISRCITVRTGTV